MVLLLRSASLTTFYALTRFRGAQAFASLSPLGTPLRQIFKSTSQKDPSSPHFGPSLNLPSVVAVTVRSMSSPSAPFPYNTYDSLPPAASFQLTSTDIKEAGTMPPNQLSKAFGVEGGQDLSPQLSWSGFPEDTKSFVVSCYDPDAPTVSGFWHWIMYDVPATVTSLETGCPTPPGKVLNNDAGFRGFWYAVLALKKFHSAIHIMLTVSTSLSLLLQWRRTTARPRPPSLHLLRECSARGGTADRRKRLTGGLQF